MGFTESDVERLLAAIVHGSDGERIGPVGQVFLDDVTDRPEWVTVNTGLFGMRESFVPLDGARLEGSALRVAYDKGTVKEAPNVDVDAGHLPEDEEDRLFAHYGRESGRRRPAADAAASGDRGPAGEASGHEDSAMTRSEEQLRVGTQTREAGRARLRKYIVTEQQTVTVPVQREEVRLEREPITESNRGAAMSGPELSEAEHEVVLHEEQVVVDKNAVPVERVRLDTETVTEDKQVTEEVRKEQIEAEGVRPERR
jgi:uncharacterized protein (TIGR02271 family)